MRVNFVLPLLTREPIGGFRIVFHYADYLASRGDDVRIIFPRTCKISNGVVDRMKDLAWPIKKQIFDKPFIPWYDFQDDVKIKLVAYPDDDSVPDADATIATAWETATPVSDLKKEKGSKFYFIQHYELWSGSTEEVDATWRLPLHKIVISKWLRENGERLGAGHMEYIPNGMDFEKFQLRKPIENRPMSIATINHKEPFKGVDAALEVLSRFHDLYSGVPIKMFGVLPKGSNIPEWINYYHNPSQDVLVDEIYNGSSVYVGASSQEGWGLPPAEAMACGCTFVGTDIGGFREFAIDEKNALLSEVGDLEGMLRNLTSLMDDRRRLTLQAEAYRSIREFTWDRAGSALRNHLQGLQQTPA